MNKKRIALFFVGVLLFTAGCNNQAVNREEHSENRMSETEVSTVTEESNPTFSMLEGEWTSHTNQISVVLKNEEQQQIEVATPYIVGGVMFLTDYDQQNHTYTFENKEEFIHFQMVNEQAAIIWYGTTRRKQPESQLLLSIPNRNKAGMMLGSGKIIVRKATVFTANSDKKSVHRGKTRDMLFALFSFLVGEEGDFSKLEAKQVLILKKL